MRPCCQASARPTTPHQLWQCNTVHRLIAAHPPVAANEPTDTWFIVWDVASSDGLGLDTRCGFDLQPGSTLTCNKLA